MYVSFWSCFQPSVIVTFHYNKQFLLPYLHKFSDPPTVSVHLANEDPSRNITRAEGENVTLKCRADARPPVSSFGWFKNVSSSLDFHFLFETMITETKEKAWGNKLLKGFSSNLPFQNESLSIQVTLMMHQQNVLKRHTTSLTFHRSFRNVFSRRNEKLLRY